MIALYRSNNIFSSRVNKYVDFYKSHNLNYRVYGWDRLGENLHKDNYSFFKYKCGYSVGGVKAVKNHCKWMKFVFSTLKGIDNVTTIHACDLNSAFPAALYKVLFNRHVVLIFDVCDWFSANFAEKRLLKYSFNLLERFTCKVADEVIICEPERIAQIPFKLKKKELILPNIPKVDDPSVFELKERYQFSNEHITLAYFGGFAQSRFLLELLDVIADVKVNLLIAGFGDEAIENKCKQISCSRDNVRYFGKLDTVTGLQMCYNADIIYAMYCTFNPNNVFAAPNKYYEAMMLGKPIISTKGTMLEKKIISQNIGYIIGESTKELKNLLSNLEKEDMCDKGRNANVLWRNKYSNYIEDFFENTYRLIIK